MERTRKIMNKIKRKLLHNRNISFKGYIRDDELFEIEAELIDTKNYDFQNHDRGTIKKDEPIHQMKIKLVLDDNLFVVDNKNNLIRKVNSSGLVSTLAGNGDASSNDGQGLTASFNSPLYITLDIFTGYRDTPPRVGHPNYQIYLTTAVYLNHY